MTPRSRGRRWRPVLFAAALLAALPVATRAAAPDLALIPADAGAFMTFRPARIAAALGVKEPARQFPFLREWKQTFGLPLTALDRCTLVLRVEENGDTLPVWVLSTVKPCNHKAVVKAWAPEARPKTHEGRGCYVTGEGAATVLFLDDRTLILADEEGSAAWLLKQARAKGPRAFADALALAATHDAVAWSRTFPVDAAPEDVARLRRARPRTRKLMVARKVAPPPAGKKGAARQRPVMLPLLPVPLPFGVESAVLAADVGKELTLEGRLECRDAASARKVGRAVRAVLHIVRGSMLAALGEAELVPLLPETAEQKVPRLPRALLGQAEAALGRAHVRTKDQTVPFTLRVAVDARTLHDELAACLKQVRDGDFAKGLPTPPPLVQRFTSPAELPPPLPLTGTSAPASVMPPPVPVGPSAAASSSPAMPPPSSPPAGKAAAPAADRSGPVGLTVANVKSEPALVFRVDAQDKLVFLKKVPQGKAVDLQVNLGQRLVAVFTDNPSSLSFTAGAMKVWLLR
jgi:hypothetical protein